MKSNQLFLQCPVRNESVVGFHVYSHSGEYSPQTIDFDLPARGVSFQFVRKYRSANSQALGPMGRGWTFSYAKTLEKEGEDVLYNDGVGRVHRFKSIASRNSYLSPAGLYTRLEAAGDTFSLRQRHGGVLIFERPETGGRLLAIEDRNGNSLKFKYNKNVIQILDPLGRRIDLRLDQNRVVALSHAGRVWQYIYSEDGCLVEVIQPPTNDVPHGPRTRYAYDEAFRLISITDPKGQIFLRNSYDDHNRVSQQKHGCGTFKFEYETIGETDLGFPSYRTQVRLKNDARLSLKHDAFGHVVERTLLVSAESLSSEDRDGSNGKVVPVITKSIFNRHGELISRTNPAGDRIKQTYDEKSTDPLAQGNLLTVNRTPSPGGDTDQAELTTRYSYERRHQQVEVITDPRGNTTRFKYDNQGNLAKKFYPAVTIPKIGKKANGKRATKRARLSESSEYNEAGQLIRLTDARGATAEYFYHPTADPGGAKNHEKSRSYTQKAGGYLARIVRDTASKGRRLKSKPTQLTVDYRYDAFGNRTTILDGNGNPTRFKYDSQDRVVETTSRKPFSHKKSFRYDANGNLCEATASFDHHHYDPVERSIIRKSTAICERFEYNSLNNPVRRTIAADGREVTHTLVRDANENVVRKILPMGNAYEYEYDERGLLVARRSGAQTNEESEIRHTYTLNGKLHSTVNAEGNAVRYDYDGFSRNKGFVDATGTAQKQWLDEIGNMTRLQVRGAGVTMNKRGEAVAHKASVLLESWFRYDELNRQVQINRAWTDPSTGKPMGKSQWDGEAGVVSTVIEYGENHLPTKVWQETGNVLNLRYDGANRPILVNDETGESVSLEYDENSNPVRIERIGPAVKGGKKSLEQIFNQEFDELDRLVSRSLNGGPSQSVVHNSLDRIIEHKNEAELSTKYLHDSLGRSVGRATTAIAPRSVTGRKTKQLLVRRVEWDDNNRLVARVNAANHSTRYNYDARNLVSSIIYADGTLRRFERDGNGNIVRLVDPNGNIVTNRLDAQGRLVERLIEGVNGGAPQVEKFHYDGLNRLVIAVTGSATTVRRYDSLSRLLEESQSGRAIKYEYDSAGNRVKLLYPCGQEVRKSYDSLRRVIEVSDGDSYPIASYAYISGTQLREQQLGNVLKAAFTYESDKDQLDGVSYRSIETGRIIEGSKCRYDAAGNRIEEIQLPRGRNSGKRYFYDSANRLVKAQYGVEHLSDADSHFEREEIYELSSTGFWQLKTIRDANGKTLKEDAGAANSREAYLSLGNRHFEYDANGNRILEGNAGENAKKRLSYDYADRLVRVECFDKEEKLVQSLEYAYDAFNRQILKRLSKGHGVTEIRRTWDGEQLIEEIEGDRLTRSFIYGSRVREPVKMHRHRSDGTEEKLYMLNARDVVTSLINEQGDAVERYEFDVFGEPSVSEVKGMPHANAQRLAVLTNPMLAHGKVFDGDAGLYFGGGFVSDPSLAESLSARSEGGFGPERSNRQQSDEPKEGDKSFSDKVIDFLIEHALGEGLTLGGKKAGMFGKVGWLGVIVGFSMGYEDDVGGHSSDPDFGRPADVIDPNSRNGGELDDYNDWIVGDPIDVHDLPNVDVPTVGVHQLPDAPIPVHDLPDAAIPVHDLPDADPGYVNRPVDIELDDDGGWVDNRTGETGGGPGSGGDSGSDTGGSHGGGCFVADTLVALGDGTTKPIGAVQVGDYVVSRDEATGKTTAQRVLRTWIHNVKATLLLRLTNGEKMETTKGHRFFVADKGFVGAGRLTPGTPLTTQNEESIQVTGMESKEQNSTVYNLEVENFHTYFVGNAGVWVHNLKMSDVDDGEDWDDDGP